MEKSLLRYLTVFLLMSLCCLFSLLQSSAFARDPLSQGQSFIDRGIQFLDEKKYDDALKAFEEAIALEPQNPLSYYYAGVAYHLKGDLRKALAPLNRAIQLAPGFPHAILEIGIVLEKLGRFDNALEAYKSLTEMKDETPLVREAGDRLKKLTVTLHYRKAERFFQEKKYEDALKELEVVFSLAPEDADAHFIAGMSYQRLKRFKEAIESFKKATDVNPRHADAYFQLAIIYELGAKYEDVISSLRKVISIVPEGPLAKEAEEKLRANENKLKVRKHFEAVADFIKQEKWAEALEEVRAILIIEPKNPNAFFNQGVILNNLKENDQAIDSLRKAIEMLPKFQKAHYQLAAIYDDAGRYDEALKSYEEVIAISEKTPDAEKAKERLNMIRPIVEAKEAAEEAKKLIGKEDIAGAIREMEILLKVKQDDPKLFASLGTLYVQAGRFREAASVLEKAVHLSPKEPDMRFMLAKTYEEMKEYEKAAEAYDIVTQQAKGTPMGEESAIKVRELTRLNHLILAGKYLKGGDYEASLREMEAVIEIAPDDPLALYNMGTLYVRLNRFEEAETALRRSVSLVPDYTSAWLQLGVVLERLRNFKEAREAFERIIEIKSDSRDADTARGRLKVVKESEELASHLDKGTSLMNNKKWNEARKEIDAVIAISPRNYLAYYYLGIILENMGVTDEAREAYKKSIEINPKFTNGYLALGDILVDEGEFNEARRVYEEGGTAGKGSPEAEIAEEKMTNLKPWRGAFSIAHGYNSNISFGSKSKAKPSVNTAYSLGMSYSLIRKKETDISAGMNYSQTIYYDTQSQPNGYSLSLNGLRKLEGGRTLSADLTRNSNYFNGKPTFVGTSFSVDAKIEPRTIPTSASFGYDFSSEDSLTSDSSDAERHKLNVSFSQKVSLRNTISCSYAFNIQNNPDPMGSNYANRTHSFSVNYSLSLMSGVSSNFKYSRSFVNYSNPDSTSFFQQFRRNTNEVIGGGFSFKLSSKISSSVNYSYAVNRTNLPRPTSEEKRKLDEILATPIPTVGGGYRQHNISFSFSLNF